MPDCPLTPPVPPSPLGVDVASLGRTQDLCNLVYFMWCSTHKTMTRDEGTT